MASTMNFNHDRQMSSFIPDNRINHGHRSRRTSNRQCLQQSNHHSDCNNNCASSYCSTCSPHEQHSQLPRQCHSHNEYDSSCHACNTPAPPLSDGQLPQSFQHCQCYRCQKTRGEPVMHPLLAAPLGLVTVGLSGAAFGIYRGITLQRRAHKLRKAAATSNAGAAVGAGTGAAALVSEVDGTGIGTNTTGASGVVGRMVYLEKDQVLGNADYAVPSPFSAVSSRSPRCESATAGSDSRTFVTEMEGSGAYAARGGRNSTGVSEIDGSPVEVPPPRYSEVVGTPVVGRAVVDRE